MYGKLLLGLALAFLANVSIAMEISKGRLISHKEWVIGKATGTAKEISNDSQNKPLKVKHESRNESPEFYEILSTIHAAPHATEGKVGEEIDLQSRSKCIIQNITQSTQTYKFISRLCTHDENDVRYDCVVSEDIVNLDPEGEARVARNPKLITKFQKAGIYNILAYNIVEAENNSRLFLASDEDSQIKISA